MTLPAFFIDLPRAFRRLLWTPGFTIGAVLSLLTLGMLIALSLRSRQTEQTADMPKPS